MSGSGPGPAGPAGGDRSPRVRLVAGVALFLAGLFALLVPGTVPDRVPGLLAAVGVLAVLAGVRAARRGARPTPFRTPDVEALPRVPVPGETLDRTLAAFLDEGEAGLLYARRVRAALTNAAVAVLARYRGLTPATARERVAAGDWTDDAVAAAFLADGDAPDAGGGIAGRLGLPGLARLRRSESAFDRGLRRSVAAVAAVAGVDVGSLSPSAVHGGDRPDGDDPGVRVGSGPAPAEGSTPGEAGPSGSDPTARPTRRWSGLGAAAALAAGAGAVAGWAGAVLAAAVGVGYAAAAGAFDPPAPSLSVDRELSTTDPDPGDRVSVTVTVTNGGDRTIPDLRVVDGVPAGLPVVEGSPRWAGPLRPGGSVTLEYALTARRGHHEFDPLLAVARDALGSRERVVRVAAAPGEGDGDEGVAAGDGDPAGSGDPAARPGDPVTGAAAGSAITCVPALTAAAGLSFRRATGRYAGEVPTGDGGEGVEFHATREYRRGDPLTRVDWNRLARHGELASREYRVERATTAVVVVDARPAAYLAPGPRRVHAVDRSVAAARSLVAALDGSGNRVGVAALGPGPDDPWLAPGTGPEHRARARHLLATTPALSSVPPRLRDGPDGGAGGSSGPDGGAGGSSGPDGGTAPGSTAGVGDGGRPDPVDPPGIGSRDGGADRSGTTGIGRPGRTEADGGLTGAERRGLRRLRARLPAGARVVFCSPVADPGAVAVARDLSARGHPVTVVSPDPTAADTPTRALGRVGRTLRLARLRDGGPTVLDWPADESLAVALARSWR